MRLFNILLLMFFSLNAFADGRIKNVDIYSAAAIQYTKMESIAAHTFLGNKTGSTAAAAPVTVAEATGLILAAFDAFDVTFAPTSPGNWTTSPDNIGDALDELAARNYITQLTNDVTAGPGGGSQAATVAAVGGKTAAAVATSVDDTLGATSANTASKIVKRDSSGNFVAGTITAALSGNSSTASALASNPSDCASDTYATTIAANGNLTCSTVTDAGLATPYVKADGSRGLSADWNAGAHSITASAFIGALTGNASTCSAFDHTPTACTGGQFATGQNADGSFICSVVDGLPSQTGNSGKYLTTNGSVASWAARANLSVGSGLTISSGSGTNAVFTALTVGIAAGFYLPTTTDQSNWDAKQAAGNYITALTSDVTASGPGSVAATVAAIQGTTVSGTSGTGNVVFSSGATLSNPVVGTQSQGDSSTKAASTSYVDTAVANNSIAKDACEYVTTAALPTVIYNNGSSGSGATLTAFAVGSLSIDGSSPTVGQRILVRNQVSDFQNGIYVVTAAGSGIAVFVLTRTSDYNVASEILAGTSVFIRSGSTRASTTWDMNSPNVATVGTDSITFAQTAGPGSVTAGTGISVTGTQVSLSSTTGSGASVLATSATLVTPTIGAALATSLNGMGISCTSGTCTFSITNGKTVSFSNTLSFSGTDSSSLNIGAGGTIGPLGYAASLSAGLDLACSTRGAVLSRGASGWVCISPGTSGYALISNGTGSDPTYQAVASSVGSGNGYARFTLDGAVVPYTGINGAHYQTQTMTLSAVNIAALNSGSSGTTTVQVNQYRSGALQDSATATLAASSSLPSGNAASLSHSLSLLSGDVVTVDVNSVAVGASDLTVAWELGASAPTTGSSNVVANYQVSGSIVPFVGAGLHYQTTTLTLSAVNISALNSGSSGSTIVQLNQYRSGSLVASATASLASASSAPSGASANLSGSLSLLAGDVVTLDVNSAAVGASDLAVEWELPQAPTVPIFSLVKKTADYTLTDNDDTVIYTGAATATFTLKSSATAKNKRYYLMNNTAYTLNVALAGGDAFQDATTSATISPGSSAIFQPDGGTSWYAFF